MDWPHAPMHRFSGSGVFFVTAGTYLKQHFYRSRVLLDHFQELLFRVAVEHHCSLQAWAIFSNHYHLVAEAAGESLHVMLSQLHSISARELNSLEGASGRKVWFQFRDTELTYEKSWMARLRYTHENPVHHRLTRVSTSYPWCSAAWFERKASRAFAESLRRFKIDRVRVVDDFDVVPADL